MAKDKPKYEAVVGIDFPSVRIERGDLLPANISSQDIADLLACNPPVIKEVPVNAERSSRE